AIENALSADGLPYIKGAPVSREKLASLLVTPDAHLITLSDPFVGFVLPSKVYGCIESGRPVLFIGSEKSDVQLLCRQSLVLHMSGVTLETLEPARGRSTSLRE